MNREPIKRKTALVRKTALGRGTASLRRSDGLARGNGPVARSRPQIERKAPKAKVTIPQRVREHVYAREEGKCVRCRGKVGRGVFERALHHVLPERTWPEFVRLAANVVLVCAGCHDEHERARRRIAISQLPAETLTWLQGLPDGPIGVYLERTYA